MPTGIYIRTEEHKRKIGKASKEIWENPEFKTKMSNIHKGKQHSEATKKKMSISAKGKHELFGKDNSFYGHQHSKKTKDLMRRKRIDGNFKGSKNPAWKGGVSESYKLHITDRKWNEIRKKVYKRDNYQCQLDGAKNKGLNSHHIIPWRVSHDDGLNNLITLCTKCHGKVEPVWWKYAPMFLEMNGVYTPSEENNLFKFPNEKE